MALQSYNQYVEKPGINTPLAASVGALIQRGREEENLNERFETLNERQDEQIAEKYRRLDEATAADAKQEMLNKYLTVKQAQIASVRDMTDPHKKRIALTRLAQDAVANGEDPGMYESLLETEGDDLLDFKMTQMLTRIDTHLGTEKPGLMKVGKNETVFDPSTGEPVFSNEAGDWEVIYDDDGETPLFMVNPETGRPEKHPAAPDTYSPAEMEQRIELIKAQEEATAAAQINTPLGLAALEAANLRVEKLQSDIDADKEKRATDAKAREAKSVEASQTRDVKRTEALGAVDVVNELLFDDSYKHAFGKSNNLAPALLRKQETIDAQAQVERVTGLLSLESRQKLKGQGTISDGEAKSLEKSATILANPLISESLARTELMRVMVIFQDAADRNIPEGELTPAELKELQALEEEFARSKALGINNGN